MIGKKAKYILFPLILIFVIAFSPAWAGYQEINDKLSTDKYVQNANNFLVLFDNSGSMEGAKFDQEKQLVTLFSNTLPTLRMGAGLRTFGENYFDMDLTKLKYGFGSYDRDSFNQAVAGLSMPYGKTPLDVALKAAAGDLKRAYGKIAVIIFTDGSDMDESPVKAAADLKAAYKDRLCIYTVQIGNDPAGAKLLDKIAQAGTCGFSAKADALANDAGMTAFVEKIFLAPKPPEAPAPPAVEEKKAAPKAQAEAVKPAEKKAPAPKKISMKLDVKFETGKAVVRPIYWWEVQKLADFMKKYPETNVTIEGYTDNVGKDAANVKLSQARANAIAKLLSAKYGIDKSRVKAVGYGPKNPIADNKTPEGRLQNRRVEAQIETTVMQ